ncbi:MAG: hypothetical protein HRU37_08565 [Roseibacillus sp.]|nr:hypothetical protein [Deltaproteobacteria bacterium]NRB27718.1 hypothetical protein [Roseibacillus sp.]HAT20409.1 hypothetical protein [Verrucomicrobiales bacterium]
MTPTTHASEPTEQSARTRLPLVLITNLCVAVFLLLALPVIHKGQQGFVQHAAANNDYVEAVIGSGEADFMQNALRTTEVARAMAHDDHVATMAIMQLTVAFLAFLFFFNSLYLFRLHRRSQQTPILPGS